MNKSSDIVASLRQRLINISHLKTMFVDKGKTLNPLDKTSIKTLQSEYQLAIKSYLPITHPLALPVLFYVDEQRFEQHQVDLYESSQGVFEAVIPVTPGITTILLIGQITETICLGQQYLITEQSEANGKIEKLVLDKDYYLDLAGFNDKTKHYELESGAMLIITNPHNKSGEFLLNFCTSN